MGVRLSSLSTPAADTLAGWSVALIISCLRDKGAPADGLSTSAIRDLDPSCALSRQRLTFFRAIFDVLQVNVGVQYQGYESAASGVDVPISLHPHTEHLYKQMYSDSDTRESRVLQVFNPKIEVIRHTAHQEETGRVRARGDAEKSGAASLGGIELVLFGQAPAQGAAHNEDFCQWDQQSRENSSQGHNILLRLVPSFASVRLPAHGLKGKQDSVVPLIAVAGKGSCAFKPPPAVVQDFDQGKPTNSSGKNCTRPAIHLDFKPYRMLGPVVVDQTTNGAADCKEHWEERVLVTVDRDPARTNGAMALPNCCPSPLAVELAACVLERRRYIVTVNTVPLVIRGGHSTNTQNIPEKRPHGHHGEYCGVVAKTGSSTSDGEDTGAQWLAGRFLSSEHSETMNCQTSSKTSSFQVDYDCSTFPKSRSPSQWKESGLHESVSMINVSSVSDPITAYLVKLDVSLNAATATLDTPRLLLILNHLAFLPLRFVHLMGSGIGATVAQLRKYGQPDVVKAARPLVRRWRWIVQGHWQDLQSFKSRRAGRAGSNPGVIEQLVRRLETMLTHIDATEASH